ncbi:MAG: penicillin-binding transpeptidase domain-containing protein, partial [Candidatus Vogelbacteria bacterium]|nr:penicillin-binding transpeptidase domain-containing protein [Candidatus Vogelbacteria bacterium]
KSIADYIVQKPVSGKDLHLAIDYRVQNKLYEIIKQLAGEKGFSGGSGVLLDVNTGEVLAISSFPEFDSNIMSVATNTAKIKEYMTNKNTPLLDRAVSGLYAPGSIFKTFVAIGALAEGIITPEKVIYTKGQISIPNPYDKTKETVFKDWKNHGAVDMRRAIAVSSDVYFYEIGGGFGSQKGLGIEKIDKYALMYGLSKKTGIDLLGEEEGVIPTPEWKAKNFNGEGWRLGNTYHTAIGQYGTQITPIQMALAYSAVANGGKMIQPTVRKILPAEVKIQNTITVPEKHLTVVKEGLRDDVIYGTAMALNIPQVEVAAKTGTAELGITKIRVNSWVTGYFPYKKPRYSFAVVMEKGERTNLVGSVYVMRQLLDWMAVNTPEYLKEL